MSDVSRYCFAVLFVPPIAGAAVFLLLCAAYHPLWAIALCAAVVLANGGFQLFADQRSANRAEQISTLARRFEQAR